MAPPPPPPPSRPVPGPPPPPFPAAPVRSESISSFSSTRSSRPRPPIPKTRTSFAASLTETGTALYHPTRASSLKPPDANPLSLTPLRAHYLKRELVTLQFVHELHELDDPSAVGMLGAPFLPRWRFVNGVPTTKEEAEKKGLHSDPAEADTFDLPFLTFVLNHFILSFPFLHSCPPTFYSHKLQPFIYSFLSRNISSSDDPSHLDVGELSKRTRIAGKVEKHLGLIMSAAIKLVDNEGKEEVVRVEETGVAIAAEPASSPQMKSKRGGTGEVAHTGVGGKTADGKDKKESFGLNVVTVRNVVMKGRMRNKTHEEFIVRTKYWETVEDDAASTTTGKSGKASSAAGKKKEKREVVVFVARRYGDFGRLAERLRKEHMELPVPSPPPKDRRTTDARSQNSSPASSQTNLSALTLSRERNRLTLRAYLRTLLNNPILASSAAFESFLTENPVQLTEKEAESVRVREEMDRVREEEKDRFKDEVEDRVGELEMYLRGFREEMVRSDGLSRVFKVIRETENVDDLPIEYRKVMEWGRISLASTVYQLFLGSDNSSSLFLQLKRMHGLMPYMLLRSILRISNPIAMVRSVLDLFLARPFGSSSLLQRMLGGGLNDEAKELREDAEVVERKIDDESLCEKIKIYVELGKGEQDRIKKEAAASNLDIMTIILRQSSTLSPPLNQVAAMQIQKSEVAYAEYKHHRDELEDSDDDEGPDNDDAWLYEDLHVLLRLLTKARDKEQLMELIFEGSTSELLKDIVTIFYEPLAKVYKAANIADSLSDLQAFVNDLIKTVEQAEDANLVDPQKTVQTFVDLVARHENRFYHFVHQVHSKGEGLFDNLMKWIELFINFVRDGLPSPVSLDYLLPVGGKERTEVLAEVDEIIEYHRKLKLAHHARMTKRMMKGELAERDKDAMFVSGVMDNLHIGNVMGDMGDVADEDSDSEAGSEAGSTDDEDHPAGALTSEPGQLEPIRSGGKKKDRAPINPPTLKHIPLIVPVFVELVREELQEARRKALERKPLPM